MGMNIAPGGAAADAGAAFGQGFQGQVMPGMQEAKESAAAQEMIEATKAIYGAELDRQDALMPDIDPGQATMMGAGGAFGALPMYLNPTPNKGQQQIDGLGEAYARNIKAFNDPKAAAVYTEAAMESLDQAHAGFIKESAMGSIDAAVQNGAVTEAQAAPFLEGIALGEDPREVYKEWRQFASDQIEGKRDAARVERMAVGMDESVVGFQAQAASDPENAAWLNSQAKEMEDLAVWVRETAMYGHNDFDSAKVWEAYQDIKYRLNPEQKHRQAMEMEAFKQGHRAELAKFSDLTRAIVAATKEGDEELAASLSMQLQALSGEGGGPQAPEFPQMLTEKGRADYDPETGAVAGDAPPVEGSTVQTETEPTNDPGHKKVNALKKVSESLLSREETGREGAISKAKTQGDLDKMLLDSVEKAGIDAKGDIAAQLEKSSPEIRGIIAAIYGQIQARMAELAAIEQSKALQAEQAERVKQPDKGVQNAARKSGGGGSPGKPIQAIP